MTGYWDVHNHILPGVDDGAGSMAETMRLIRQEYDQGVRHIIATPHYRRGMFEVPMEEKRETYLRVKEQAKEQYPDLELLFGCEYYARRHMLDHIVSDAGYQMPGGKAVLTEFSYTADLSAILGTAERLRLAGFVPVIAHFERYHCLHNDDSALFQLKKTGAYLQMNCDGILGIEGFRMKRFCVRALKDDLVDLIASDAHNTDTRSVHIAETAAFIRKKFGEARVRRILMKNPEELFRREDFLEYMDRPER